MTPTGPEPNARRLVKRVAAADALYDALKELVYGIKPYEEAIEDAKKALIKAEGN